MSQEIQSPPPAPEGWSALTAAARAVLETYDRARAEKYDELSWAELRDTPFEYLRAALAVQAPAVGATGFHRPERLTRFCPGCGSVGDVESIYRDCYPDGGDARVIPEPLAFKCRSLFKLALKANASDEPTSLREAGVGTRLPSSERLNLLGRWFEGRGMESMARICRTAANELKAAGAPWQPIETAPVGRVHSPPLRAIVAEVLDDGTPYVGEAWFEQERGKWWAANMDGSDAPGSTIYPTHWMPLPAAPKDQPPVHGTGGDA